ALLACSGEDNSVPVTTPAAEPAPIAAAPVEPAPVTAVEAGPRVVGTAAYITLGREPVTLNEPLTIIGAAAGGSAGIERVELLVDGQLFARANYGEKRPIGGPIGDADPNKPNLGFSITL